MKSGPPAYVVPGYTFFYWGFTLPKEFNPYYRRQFEFRSGNLFQRISIQIGGKQYPARIRLARIRTARFPRRDVVQVAYEHEWETLKALRKLLIYSYATTLDKKKPKLKELIKFSHIGGNKFSIEVISKQTTDFDHILRSLEDRNLLEYWKDKRALKESFVRYASPRWMSARELGSAKGLNAVYFLYHRKDRQLYVGKANRLANRVKIGSGRVGLKGDWDKFMFFEISPAYSHLLPKIETFAMRTLATVLPNDLKIAPLNESRVHLVNRHLRNKST